MYKYLQLLKRILLIFLYKVFCLFKIDNNKVILYSPSNYKLKGNLFEIYTALVDKNVKVFFKEKNIISFLYHVATSKVIITDDFAPIMYVLKIRKEIKFIQVWHASGAFKSVGFKRPTVNKNSLSHKNYTDVIVSSTNIVDDYSEAFGIDKSKIHALGTIKTDLFYNKERLKNIKKYIYKKYNLKNKKIILYAPTFRGSGIKSAHFENMLNLDRLIKKLGKDYVILFKNHPFVNDTTTFKSENVINISKEDEIDYILPFIDLLITDYSSVIFDAIINKKPVIYYVPDLKEYKKSRGFYYDFEEYNYGKIVSTQKDLIETIKNPVMDKKKMKQIKEKHINMCDGKSLERFMNMYFN